ncbi:D-tyrosyl-tRNA(Tyr) deacylase [Microgenomates group bacterium RIFCSPLOWO2_01_FULL_46_13]|nr:MAG: D-tyrosyl-tRNA(Tyr) deacylase [Microgenomates group bacterium RIFCSPHIGHO2_01_FULL_45_11]OGV94778.1 MAG: D-tyrosyl-tRNA(Tyr) deacylase [Microgenomates group bacterium RIFCSPLOWO2_01_FULL_46_13]
MKLVIQRVDEGLVTVADKVVGKIGGGYVVLVGIGKNDEEKVVRAMAKKLIDLRIMADEKGKMNQSIVEVSGEILLVSQFTLYAQTAGRRPGFTQAASPDEARKLFELFVNEIRKAGVIVQTGQFGEYMKVTLTNDGPVTIILES